MTVLSWQGRGLKLETAGDVETLLEGVDPLKVEEVRLGGNTFGVDASKAMGDFLAKAVNIKVCIPKSLPPSLAHRSRSPTLRTYSQVA
jgi:Ran GTPase-activating protein (RanGAP) involved in mRNA processing and transport